MPVVARFYGIVIRTYSREHGVPHFHAIYGVFEIGTLEMIEGEMPLRAQRLVREWAGRHQGELQEMWNTRRFQKLSGLD